MGPSAGSSQISLMNDQYQFLIYFFSMRSKPSIGQNDWPYNMLPYNVMVTTLFVYTLVNSRLFSHQVVSQGNIYYPIITTMPMSPMCEAVFTWLYTISSWKTLWLCRSCLSHWDTGAISQMFPTTQEDSRRHSVLHFLNSGLQFHNYKPYLYNGFWWNIVVLCCWCCVCGLKQ